MCKREPGQQDQQYMVGSRQQNVQFMQARTIILFSEGLLQWRGHMASVSWGKCEWGRVSWTDAYVRSLRTLDDQGDVPSDRNIYHKSEHRDQFPAIKTKAKTSPTHLQHMAASISFIAPIISAHPSPAYKKQIEQINI